MTDYTWIYGKEEILELLPVSYAGAHCGIQFGPDGRAVCPWHDDHDPSLELGRPAADGIEWWICPVCRVSGDVLRLIERSHGCDFPRAIEIASEMLQDMPPDFEPIRAQGEGASREFDGLAWEERLGDWRRRAEENRELGLMAYARKFVQNEDPPDMKTAWESHLISWGWGLGPAGEVAHPHWSVDGILAGVKVRHASGHWRAHGSFDALYGAWRQPVQGVRQIVVCEGESDTVWAAAMADVEGLAVHVVGLPSGARKPRPDWKLTLDIWDTTYAILDGDEAGRTAASRWADEQPDAWVHVCPEGRDLRTSDVTLREALSDVSRADTLLLNVERARVAGQNKEA